MRGKIISPLLIAVFFVSLIANLPLAQAPGIGQTMITVEPTLIEGLPGDTITIDIMIDKAVQPVYAFEVKLQYPPYQSVLLPYEVIEGPFLATGGLTQFASKDDPFNGELLFGATLIGDYPGVTGAGLLATIKFFVSEAGAGPLALEETYLVERRIVDGDPVLIDIPHQSRDGYYSGPTANLVRKELTRRDMLVGETLYIDSSVKNEGTVPLYVKVLFEISRVEDGAFNIVAGGQTKIGWESVPEYLYVDSYYHHPASRWNRVGTSPYLDAQDDGNYIWDDTYCHFTLIYGFEDATAKLSPDDVILGLYLDHYAAAEWSEIDADVMTWNPTFWDWLGSLECESNTFAWRTVANQDPVHEVVPSLMDPAVLDTLEVAIHWWTPDGSSGPDFTLDAMRIRIMLANLIPVDQPYVVVEPNDNFEMPPVEWPLANFDVGHYECTARAWYSYHGEFYNPGPKISTFNFKVDAP